MAQKTTLKEFEAVFPKLEEVLLAHAKQYNLPQAELDWYKKVSLSPSPRFPSASLLSNHLCPGLQACGKLN